MINAMQQKMIGTEKNKFKDITDRLVSLKSGNGEEREASTPKVEQTEDGRSLIAELSSHDITTTTMSEHGIVSEIGHSTFDNNGTEDKEKPIKSLATVNESVSAMDMPQLQVPTLPEARKPIRLSPFVPSEVSQQLLEKVRRLVAQSQQTTNAKTENVENDAVEHSDSDAEADAMKTEFESDDDDTDTDEALIGSEELRKLQAEETVLTNEFFFCLCFCICIRVFNNTSLLCNITK
ncbi:hypothetical protein RFI_36735 [Reticulomyxa filosa]|uniref:Uncharacterized protein n=1 Tax=Reticulomyxa filosa TaxID=46433 RepID=X6LH40_RETFI|nr:hypothetical protein RFI_36735 [Reticulomyxa filosa]|eukprot:ETO00706.1 hypothetical protein RFI_36735 [Reticulomyxa filosa]